MEEFFKENYQWIISTIIAIIALWGSSKIIKKYKQRNNNAISNNNCSGDMYILSMTIPINELNLPTESLPVVKSFLNQIATFLKDKRIQNIDFLSKTNNKFAIYDAIKAIARNDIPEKRLILCQLLAEKVRQDEIDDSDDEYAQAIESMNKLSIEKIHKIVFIEILTKVLAYNYKGNKLPDIQPITSFINQLNEITEEQLNYLIHIGLIQNLYPKELDLEEIKTIPINPQETLLMSTIKSIQDKHKTINFKLYVLSPSGHQIAKAYINNYLGIDYVDNFHFPQKPTTLHLDYLTVEKDVQAGGDIYANGGVAAKSSISPDKFKS